MTRRQKTEGASTRSINDIRPQNRHEGYTPWTGVDSDALSRCVSAVTSRGDALLIGTTSDGGAMTLLIMSNDTKRRFYSTDQAEMGELLGEIADWAENT